MLHRAERHEALSDAAWSEARARETMAAIVDETVARFHPRALWPAHPGDTEDEGRPGPIYPLYAGAAGVMWTLHRLHALGAAELDAGFSAALDDTLAGLLETSHAVLAADDTERASFFIRDAGILLLQWKRLGGNERADALYAVVEGNLHHPARESLWGSSGTLVAAIHMAEATRDPRWAALLRRGIDILLEQMHEAAHSAAPQRPVRIWTQDLYGRTLQYMGAGHGFAGNVYPVLRGAPLLDPAQVRAFEDLTYDALDVCAVREGDAVNWEPMFDPAAAGHGSRMLMQDCHGAPGIVNRLAASTHEGLRALLVAGGEAIWRAGPLVKPPGLCHGTDGNGYAFLKLFDATGDERWLDRARAFAMHACAQSDRQAAATGHRRYSLWTGDLGLAIYLQACLDAPAGARAALPTLDVF